MNAENQQPNSPALPESSCSAWLGEQWTEDDIHDARHVLSAVYEGVDCNLPISRMRELERRGLVADIIEGPKRGCKAGRYQYLWTDKLEQLVRASNACSPNA